MINMFVPDSKVNRLSEDGTALAKLCGTASKSATLCMLVIAWPQLVLAETTTINGYVTGTQGPTTPPLNGSDAVIVTQTGSIQTTGDNNPGVSGQGGSNTIRNESTIRTTGDGSPGIVITGSENTIITSGTVVTVNSSAIRARSGASNAISNAGDIRTSGPGSKGIHATGAFNTISNSGSIATTGDPYVNIRADVITASAITAEGISVVVTNSGSISTDGLKAYGMHALGDSYDLTNTGTINTTGDNASGIRAIGNSGSITNSGSISTAGSIDEDGADGIYIYGDSGVVVNSGSIITTGISSYGAFAVGNFHSILSSGSISINGPFSDGIGLIGNTNSIVNTGGITASGTEARGISVFDGSVGNTIDNRGDIRAAGARAFGVYANGSFNTISNSGAISASGEEAVGVAALGGSSTISNSGSVVSQSNYAIYFDGSGNMLEILGGTINGDINMGSAGAINIANGTTIDLGGVISGSDGLAFGSIGSGGRIILSGANTYTGSTAVENRVILSVNGSITSSSGLTVNSGGTIGGTGSLPQTYLVSGATLAPGNSIGTITVAGLSLNGGSIDAEIQGPQNDRINVTGQVTNFTGTANLIPYGGGSPWPNFTYTIVSAPNSADFATSSSLTLDQRAVTSALLRSGTTLIQNADGDPKTFDVQWQPSNRSGATTSAMQNLGQGTSNQLATAGAVDRVFRSLATNAASNANNSGTLIGSTGFTTGQAAAAGLSADFLSATSQLLSLTSNSQLTAAINSLSPEPYAAFQSVGLDTLKRQRELLLSQAGSCPSTGWVVNAPTSTTDKQPKQPLCVFAQASNATSSINGQNGLSSYDSGIFSTYYGVEFKPAKPWTIGAAYGYGSSYLNNMTLTNALVSSGVNSGSLYAVYKPSEPWTIRGLLGYSNFNATGSRTVAAIGTGSAITASPSANGYTAAINADYLIQLTKPTAKTAAYLKPLLGIAWGGYQQESFSEASSGALNLNVSSHTANSLLGTIGLELATAPIALNRSKTMAITPRLTMAYQVDALGNDTGVKSLTSSFAQAPTAGSFTTQGENRGVNTFSIDGGINLQVASNASVYANVGYEAFSTGSQFTYGGGVKVKF
jgi:uncharacterized protein with beta-barrel porin domain